MMSDAPGRNGKVVALAEYRARRKAAPAPPDPDVPAIRPVVELSSRQAAHRQRMLRHLSGLTVADAVRAPSP